MKPQAFMLDRIATLQQHLRKDHRLLQIGFNKQGEKGWIETSGEGAEPLYGQEHLPLVSPKGFLFADNEALFEFNGETFAPILPDVRPQVLFGVQACDLTAIAYQDKFFEFDRHYQARREQTLLVGIDCSAPCEKGFCPQVNAGPHVIDNSTDLILCDLSVNQQDNSKQAQWLLIAATKKGLLSLQNLQLQSADTSWKHLRNELKQQVVAKFPDLSYINNSIKYINDNLVPAQLWEELSVRCLGCSGCTNLCPTCSCYTTYEQRSEQSEHLTEDPEQTSDKHTTLRCWDSCQFEGFQREASGHNPSHLAAQRTERFWFHKFSDDYLPEFGRYGCVGCGRCEQTCPGSIGVHSVMQRIDQRCCN
jgi:sulfhydrogenase subunit beta (sulfur reductase)